MTHAFAVAVLAAGIAHAAPGDEAYAAAQQAYAACHWRQARVALTAAAEAGHVRAQEMLGFVLLRGDDLYGGAVATDRAAARAWFERAARGGSEVAVVMSRQLAVARSESAPGQGPVARQ